MNQFENLCDQDNKNCNWSITEKLDSQDNLISWDFVCLKCDRTRDWNKEERISQF